MFNNGNGGDPQLVDRAAYLTSVTTSKPFENIDSLETETRKTRDTLFCSLLP